VEFNVTSVHSRVQSDDKLDVAVKSFLPVVCLTWGDRAKVSVKLILTNKERSVKKKFWEEVMTSAFFKSLTLHGDSSKNIMLVNNTQFCDPFLCVISSTTPSVV
jgi:hypothetical protein